MDDIWNLVEQGWKWVIAPSIALAAWFYRDMKSTVDTLSRQQKEDREISERRHAVTEMAVAVLNVKLDDVKEDIREIKRGVEKLVDRSDNHGP